MKGTARLQTAMWESDRHLDVLETALRDWRCTPATDLKQLEADHKRLRVLDQERTAKACGCAR